MAIEGLSCKLMSKLDLGGGCSSSGALGLALGIVET